MKLADFLKALFVSVLMLTSTTIVFAQEQKYDLIIKNDGTKIEAVVKYIELDVVKYKNFNNLEGPTYSIKKEDIATILYANGSVDVFQQTPKSSISYQNINQPKEKNCAELKEDFQKAKKIAENGNGLWISGTMMVGLGAFCVTLPIISYLETTPTVIYTTVGVCLMSVGIHLIIPGAILAGIGNGKMRRINNEMIEVCSLPLNKDTKYPVNLSFTTNGLALRF